jgi:hypothetical protein
LEFLSSAQAGRLQQFLVDGGENELRFRQLTKAQLDAAAIANELAIGEPYWVSDEGRVAIGISVNNYQYVTSGLNPGYRSGLTYCLAESETATATLVMVANVLRAWPWRIRRRVTFTDLNSEVATPSASTSYRLALYLDNGSYYPGSLIAQTDAQQYSSGAAGQRPATLAPPITLEEGIVWLACNASGTPTLRGLAQTVINPILGTAPGINGQRTCWSIPLPFAAMPATFPIGATASTNTNAPIALFTAA